MQTRNLSIGYANRVVASGINISLEAGKLSCLIGENGAGKSTLLRTLAGFQKPLSGEILITPPAPVPAGLAAYPSSPPAPVPAGSAASPSSPPAPVPDASASGVGASPSSPSGAAASHAALSLFSIPKRQLARTISVVLTDKPDIQNSTVRELVSMGRMPYTGFFGRLSQEDNRIVDECLEITGVESTRKVNSLSDGERQKVMIARALAQQTPYIFLDEPTAFLDYPSKVRVMEMLRMLARQYNKTVLLSTHDLEIALDIADRIVMMEKSQVIIGNPKKYKHEKIDSFTADNLLTEYQRSK